MSKHRQDTENGQLPLPSPRSPRELDQRILAHARANASQKQRMNTAGWLGGVATTAVLVVAVYLTNTTDTNPELAPAAPAILKKQLELKEETSGAAAPMANKARPKLKSSADFDARELAPAEQEEPQLESTAQATVDSLGSFRAMHRADDTAPNLQGTLRHLQELVLGGEQEQALREYQELRNACSECGLPDTLEEALKSLQ